jgi:V8-like Glu-specific endopeptidase
MYKRIGRDNSDSVQVFRRATDVSKTVALVERSDGEAGTGFLIAGDLLMTNHHVLPSALRARGGTARFGFEEGKDGSIKKGTTVDLDPDRYFHAVKRLDYAIVALAEPIGDDLGHLDVDAAEPIELGEDVFLIGHPSGRPKEVVLSDNDVLRVDPPMIGYEADTERISSGSPVFSPRWQLVALHHHSTKDDRRGNEGVLMYAIAENWKRRP